MVYLYLYLLVFLIFWVVCGILAFVWGWYSSSFKRIFPKNIGQWQGLLWATVCVIMFGPLNFKIIKDRKQIQSL